MKLHHLNKEVRIGIFLTLHHNGLFALQVLKDTVNDDSVFIETCLGGFPSHIPVSCLRTVEQDIGHEIRLFIIQLAD